MNFWQKNIMKSFHPLNRILFHLILKAAQETSDYKISIELHSNAKQFLSSLRLLLLLGCFLRVVSITFFLLFYDHHW